MPGAATGAWESLTDLQRETLIDLAGACRAYVQAEKPLAALRMIHEAELEVIEYIALWEILDSKIRNPIREIDRETDFRCHDSQKPETNLSSLWPGAKKVHRAE